MESHQQYQEKNQNDCLPLDGVKYYK